MKSLKLQLLFVIISLLMLLIHSACKPLISKQYKLDAYRVNSLNTIHSDTLKEKDILHLPIPVQHYLRYAGVINKPKVTNIHAKFSGRIRQVDKAWMNFNSVQTNTIQPITRLFYMKATANGLPIVGYHTYNEGNARMKINLLSFFNIVDIQSKELNIAETVTVFNDMCILSPSLLIDKNISWHTIDNLTVNAIYTCNSIQISANLYFNEKGELINFISSDRYYLSPQNKLEKHIWSTPLSDYKEYNGYRIASKGKAVWHLQNNTFCYGEFNLQSLEVNVETRKI